MKKITLSIIALFFAGQMSFAQAVSDHAVIPVSVTLNSILRLNVVTGGNIEFVVNTINQYKLGITNTTQYTTNFTVASSTNFNVTLAAEEADLTGSDNSAHTMPITNIGYTVLANSGAVDGADGTEWILLPVTGDVGELTDIGTPRLIVEGVLGEAAGDVTQNTFDINWELGTPDVIAAATGSTLLAQSIKADRYVVNVFLDLLPQ